jgi:hypothetical protein
MDRFSVIARNATTRQLRAGKRSRQAQPWRPLDGHAAKAARNGEKVKANGR